MQLNSFKDVPWVQIETVSPESNDSEEPPTKDVEQLPIPIKTVSPELNNSEEPPTKDAKQLPTPIKSLHLNQIDLVEPPTKDAKHLPTPSRMVHPDLLQIKTPVHKDFKTTSWIQLNQFQYNQAVQNHPIELPIQLHKPTKSRPNFLPILSWKDQNEFGVKQMHQY